ncbi:MAG: low molecular weight phosphotyrosine protein phosphatase [Betaproteobacteria bacterium]|nr:low molecular weight phosphotyrosine protein phosphatase [Betaproteobacteria bacterium]
MEQRFHVLFVCMGNICRSPTAEAVFRHCVAEAGLQHRVITDSAGTHDYHVGDPPDERAQRAARARGYDMSDLRGRQVSREDFARFELVLAMDEHNLRLLARRCPAEHAHKLRLFMEFGNHSREPEVPDPYYGGAQGFELVLDMIEDAAQGLLRHIQAHLTV